MRRRRTRERGALYAVFEISSLVAVKVVFQISLWIAINIFAMLVCRLQNKATT